MIQQTLEKTGDRFVVTIPKEEVERYGLKEGQLLGLYVVPLEGRPVMRPELRAALDRSWERNADVYRELAEAEKDASDL
jgi:bifunctional DNA-binding transcriptional regulator/antitoxin component of YhaV-PrlF toxin-antitoxin module